VQGVRCFVAQFAAVSLACGAATSTVAAAAEHGGRIAGALTAEPQPIVSNAFFRTRWHESVFDGELIVGGEVAESVTVRLVLRQGDRVRMSTSLAFAPGPFARALAVPRSLLPGEYVLEVVPGADAGTVAGQAIRLALAPPREGVVRVAYASTSRGGAPLTRFPRTTSVVFAHFAFAALPRPALPLSVSWYRPGGKLAGPRRGKRASALVTAFVGGRKGAPLPRGVWQSVIRAGPIVVKRLRFRVG
jgi:hypothetical protein